MVILIPWIAIISLEHKILNIMEVCINKDFWGIVMPSGKDNILNFNQYLKPYKMSYIIYDDIESLIKI